jgi:hypothetical protein
MEDLIWRARTGEIHRNGGIASFGPEKNPGCERGAATAVDEDNGRKTRSVRCGNGSNSCGGGVKREDVRRVSLERQALVEKGMDRLITPQPGDGRRLGLDCVDVPRRRGCDCGGERQECEESKEVGVMHGVDGNTRTRNAEFPPKQFDCVEY